MPGCCHRPNVWLVAQRAVDVAEELWALVPPVAEQLGVEGGHHDATSLYRMSRGDGREQAREVSAVRGRHRARGQWVVRFLLAEVDGIAGDAPQPEPAGPPNLVELEIAPVAGIA